MKRITVADLMNKFSLDLLTCEHDLNNQIEKSPSRRPGLEFIDYFEFLPMGQVQVFGENEVKYLHMLTEKERDLRVGNIIQYNPPCIIVTDGQSGLKYLRKYCLENDIPLLRTEETNYEFIRKLDSFLIKTLAEEIAIHGVCINVYGTGILIRGKSGVGKSETAHALIGRGHRLVADDIVVLKKLSPQTLLGTHNEKNKQLLALRSIGLLNIVKLYGQKAFKDETRISLDIELVKWEGDSLHNELELKPEYREYMGVKIPYIQIQLKPGRDVTGLIEAAVNNWALKQQEGYSAAEEFKKRIMPDEG